jgi:hypothetical protein
MKCNEQWAVRERNWPKFEKVKKRETTIRIFGLNSNNQHFREVNRTAVEMNEACVSQSNKFQYLNQQQLKRIYMASIQREPANISNLNTLSHPKDHSSYL